MGKSYKKMICRKCNKPGEFYKSSKYICKDCCKKRSMQWIKKNPEKVRLHRIINRQKNKEKHYEYYKEWYAKNGRKRNKIQMRAHALVQQAINTRKIKKPSLCSGRYCIRDTRIEAHHDDYSKPLSVIWLCNRCHRKKHSGFSS